MGEENIMPVRRAAHKKARAKQARRPDLGVRVPEPAPSFFAVGDLQLDARNPRLPENIQSGSPDDLLRHIAVHYEPLEIGRSIARHGYFPSEPIIVVKEGGENIVVEGNRRVVALQLLADPDRAADLELEDAIEWAQLASEESFELPTDIPSVVAKSREAVAPILGFRHISGIEPWEPWAQARFLSSFIDTEGKSFEESAALVGETERAVRESYRNYRVARQMAEFGIDITEIINRFGVFTRAMQDTGIREFLKGPIAPDVKSGAKPLPNSAKSRANAKDLAKWVFGAGPEEPPLFTDSRKLSELGLALQSKEGLKELRETGDLEAAFSLAGGLRNRLLERLNRAASSLAAAKTDIDEYRDDEDVQTALSLCDSHLRALQGNEGQ
jgi:hypothetical protein